MTNDSTTDTTGPVRIDDLPIREELRGQSPYGAPSSTYPSG